MSDPAWAWYEDDGVTLNASQSWAPSNGVPTSPAIRRLYNDIDGTAGSVDSEDFLLTAVSRPSGVGDYSVDDELAAGGYIEVRLTGYGGTGMLPQTSGWFPVGRGRYLSVRSIKATGYRTIEQRINVPLGVGILAKDYKLAIIEEKRAISLESGHYEGGAQGIRMGLGDGSFTSLLAGFEILEAGTPDNTVTVAYGVKIFDGVPSVNVEEVLTFNDEDSAAVALASGEEYPVLVSVDSTATATATKGLKGAYPLSEANLPDLPAGHREIGWFMVPFSAVIAQAGISQANLEYGCAKLHGDGLAPSIHPFQALIGNAFIISPNKIPVTLADDSANYIWVSPSAAVDCEQTGIQPSTLSQLLYEVTVAAGVVTVTRDCRQFLYPNPVEVILQRQGTLAAAQVAYGVLPSGASAYLLPIGGVTAAVGDRGATSGATDFNILATDRNNTYVTIYTGAVDEPGIAFDAAEPVDTDSIPKVLLFKGGTRFKMVIDAIPGTASVEGIVRMRFSACGAA